MVRLLRSRREESRELLPAEFQHYLDAQIAKTEWYPARDYVVLMRACARLMDLPEREALVKLGEVAAALHLKGVYSDLATSRRSSALGPTLWASLYEDA